MHNEENPCPINEHQKAVLNENWNRPIKRLSKSSKIIPIITETMKSRMNILFFVDRFRSPKILENKKPSRNDSSHKTNPA